MTRDTADEKPYYATVFTFPSCKAFIDGKSAASVEEALRMLLEAASEVLEDFTKGRKVSDVGDHGTAIQLLCKGFYRPEPLAKR